MSLKESNIANIIWGESGIPISNQFSDPYFCKESGLEESRYVFLQQNNLPKRFKQHQGSFNIFENGFGTGLNFLACIKLFSENRHSKSWLNYFSVEKYPLSKADLIQALSLWPELKDEAQILIANYPILKTGQHSFSWPEKRVTLTLAFSDINQVLPQFNNPVHAWFLDGFAPTKNPEMWSDSLFKHMGRISALSADFSPHHSTTVATFTASGLVRRGLIGGGFEIEKTKGFGKKRHMLKGLYKKAQGPTPCAHFKTQSWHLPPPSFTQNSQITIVGAGLAGAASAYALAIRGYQVVVIDKAGIAQGASGNPVGGLYIKLAIDEQSLHNQFYLAGYLYSLNLIQKLLEPEHVQSCGLLQLAYNDKEIKRQQAFLENTSLPEELVKSAHYNNKPALSFPFGGWISPSHLCQSLLAHKNIQVIQDELISFTEHSEKIELSCKQKNRNTNALILACANEAKSLLNEHVISTKAIRGQISYIDASQAPELNHVLCGSGYLAPAKDGFHCLGASYQIGEESTEVREQEHLSNLEILKEFDKHWHQHANIKRIVGGRASLRCSSSDYLPLAGALIEPNSFKRDFAKLSQQAKQLINQPVVFQQGLYLNIGHGSRGISSALLCAEIIARQINGEPAPLEQKIMNAISPNRFLIRSVTRSKPAQTRL